MTRSSTITTEAAHHVAGHAILAWRRNSLPSRVMLSIPAPELEDACPADVMGWFPEPPEITQEGDSGARTGYFRTMAMVLFGGWAAQSRVAPELAEQSAERCRLCGDCGYFAVDAVEQVVYPLGFSFDTPPGSAAAKVSGDMLEASWDTGTLRDQDGVDLRWSAEIEAIIAEVRSEITQRWTPVERIAAALLENGELKREAVEALAIDC